MEVEARAIAAELRGELADARSVYVRRVELPSGGEVEVRTHWTRVRQGRDQVSRIRKLVAQLRQLPACELELRLLRRGEKCGKCCQPAEQHRNWRGLQG